MKQPKQGKRLVVPVALAVVVIAGASVWSCTGTVVTAGKDGGGGAGGAGGATNESSSFAPAG